LSDVLVEYTDGSGAYVQAQAALGSDNTQGMPAPSVGAAYRFVWDAAGQGLTTSSSVMLRFTPSTGGVAGTPFVTGAFSVDTSDPHQPPPYVAPAPVVPKLVILAGNNQTVISGQQAASALIVQATSGGQGVPGVSIWFRVTGVKGAAEDDWVQSTVTDTNGNAGTQIRFVSGAVGTAKVLAGIVGFDDPAAVVTFTLKVVQPQILIEPPAPSFTYGNASGVMIYYDGDGNPNTSEYRADIFRPVSLKVTVQNAICSHSVLRMGTSSTTIQVTPTTLSTSVVIKLEDMAYPGVVATQTFPVSTSPNVSKRIGPGTTDYTGVTVQMLLTQGLLGGAPQVGYSGLQLTQPFVVSLQEALTTGGTPDVYTETDLGFNPNSICTPPQPAPLQVFYTAYSGGTVWKAVGPRTDGALDPSTLQVPVGTPVYFTPPASPGPWMINVTVNDEPLDPHPNQYSGPGWCIRDNTLDTGGSTHWAGITFPIQAPANVTLLDQAANPLTSAKLGDNLTLNIAGLSPYIYGTPATMHLESLVSDGGAPRSYTYTGIQPAPFTQDIDVFQRSGGVPMTYGAQTQVILPLPATPQDPFAILSATLSHWYLLSACPLGWLHFTGSGIDISFPVDGHRIDRRTGIAGLVQESPTGTTPASGASGTISLSTGEFIYRTVDLEVMHPISPLSFGRTYRSQIRSSGGPLGPGWTLDHGEFLKINSSYFFRWFDASGRFADFPMMTGSYRPYGQLFDVQWNFTVDDTTSPFVITSAHADQIHFNADGSLRFVLDTNGNKCQYGYDTYGKLSSITDSLGRVTTLEYWQRGAGVANEIIGCLKQITDPAGRSIDYQYYEPGDPDGQVGWLKKVLFPLAPTMINGFINPNYQRTETYIYEINSADPLEARLLRVVDSEGENVLINHYDGASEHIGSQEFGVDPATGKARAFGFAYKPFPRTTTVTDRVGNVVEYEFPSSYYPDAAAPVKVTETAASGNRIWSMVHDLDGQLVEVHSPTGVQALRVFQASSDGRQVGNLNALRVRGIAGQERIWSYEYGGSGDFNFVSRVAGPQGNLPGMNSSTDATTYWYDQNGNLIEVLPPVTHQLVMVPDPVAGLKEQWTNDAPVLLYRYNSTGLLRRSMDPHGVVSEYSYFPKSDPLGAAGSTPTPDESGFLAQIVVDVQGDVDGNPSNPRRDFYLPSASVPLDPQKTTLLYDTFGHLIQVTDPWGVITNFQDDLYPNPNPLHEVTKITRSMTGMAGSEVRRFSHTSSGYLGRMDLETPGATTGTVPAMSESWQRDALGNATGRSITGSQGGALSEEWLRDANDELLGYRPPALVAGRFASSGCVVSREERGLPQSLAAGVAVPPASTGLTTISSLLQAGLTYDPKGMLSSTTAPNGEIHTRYYDELSQQHASIDPLSNVNRAVTDDTGLSSLGAAVANGTTANTANAPLPPFDPSHVGGSHEHRKDELGRLTRLHLLLHIPSTPPPPSAIKVDPAVDYLPGGSTVPNEMRDVPSPAVSGTSLTDGPWGKADGRITSDIMYDACGRISRIVDDELGVTRHRYDSHGRIAATTLPWGEIEIYNYDLANHLIELRRTVTSTDLKNPQTATYLKKTEYDWLGRIARFVDGAGNAVRYEYDEFGELFHILDAVAPDSAEIYNGAKVNGDGNRTTCQRDDLGQLKRIETLMTVDGVGGSAKEITTWNASGVAGLTMEYEPGGNLKAFQDDRGNRFEIGFDDYGRSNEITYRSATPGVAAVSTTLSYDPADGRIAHVTDERGTTLHHTYDGLGRSTGTHVDTPAPGLQGSMGYTVDYQPEGSCLYTDITTGLTVLQSYDSCGRLVSETQGTNQLSFVYDGAGRIKQLNHPTGGGSVTYAYRPDGSGRLSSVLDGTNTIASFNYLGDSEITRQLPGVTTTTALDGQTARLTATSSNTTGQINFAVTSRDRMGRIKVQSRTGGNSSESYSWTYDSLGRVRTELYSAPAGLGRGNDTITRGYDADGVLRDEIRLRILTPGNVEKRETSQTGDERGRIVSQSVVTQVNGTTTASINNTILYDANGNLANDGTNQYVYDAWNRLIQVNHAGAPIAAYSYDPLDRCIQRTSGTLTEDYIYDGNDLIEVRVGGTVTERYIYSNRADDILAVTLGSTGYYLIYSPEGNVDSIVGAQNNLLESYLYSLWGNATVVSPQRTIVDEASPVGKARPLSRFLFKGRYYDPDAGLYYWQSRWYHPSLGQFLTPDSVGPADSSNLYALAKSDPINCTDSGGTLTDDEIRAEARDDKRRDMEHFAGAVAGAGANVGSGLRMFFYDWWAQTFSNAARERVKGAQDWMADGFSAVHEGKGTAWIAEGIEQRAKAMGRAELEGRYFDAAYIWGDTCMNAYTVGRAGLGVARASFGLARGLYRYGPLHVRIAQNSGFRVALRSFARCLRNDARNPGVGLRAPVVRRSLSRPSSVGEIAAELREMNRRIGPTSNRGPSAPVNWRLETYGATEEAGGLMMPDESGNMVNEGGTVVRARGSRLAYLRQGYKIDFVLRRPGEMYIGNKHWLLAGEGPGGIRGGGSALAAGELMTNIGPEGELGVKFSLHSGTYNDMAACPQAPIGTEPFRAMYVMQELQRIGIRNPRFVKSVSAPH
jgi:RHS repeat-associated protein